MKYQITEKKVPATIVYYSEIVLKRYPDVMQWIPSLKEKCLKLNPDMKCKEPSYEFFEYLDGEYKDMDIKIRHNEAVIRKGIENEYIKFCELPGMKALCIYHKGAYDAIGEAYAYILKYTENNGYKITGLTREWYIDGIWNKELTADWLTEIQLPIK